MSLPHRLLPLAFLALLGCQSPKTDPAAPVALRDLTRNLFHLGVAINAEQITGDDRVGADIVATHFDSITAENAMKWQHLQPAPGRFEFALADRFVALGRREGKQVIGHTLMWHSQTPDWVFQHTDGSEVSREELLRRLREHIRTVVGRYKGQVAGWDVVNEAIRDEDGTLRTDKPWYRILGEEGIFAAFAAAHEADPEAELYYNDYSLENPAKRAGVLKLVQAIRARGLRIDGIGSQGHYLLKSPTAAEIDTSITDLASTGLKVMFTELDVTVLPRPDHYLGAEIGKVFAQAPELDPYRDGLPADRQAELARRYAEIFAVFAKHHRSITRVTVWGVTDRTSWLNGWPIRGRTDYPVLFDRAGAPKPALDAVRDTLRRAQAAPAD